MTDTLAELKRLVADIDSEIDTLGSLAPESLLEKCGRNAALSFNSILDQVSGVLVVNRDAFHISIASTRADLISSYRRLRNQAASEIGELPDRLVFQPSPEDIARLSGEIATSLASDYFLWKKNSVFGTAMAVIFLFTIGSFTVYFAAVRQARDIVAERVSEESIDRIEAASRYFETADSIARLQQLESSQIRNSIATTSISQLVSEGLRDEAWIGSEWRNRRDRNWKQWTPLELDNKELIFEASNQRLFFDPIQDSNPMNGEDKNVRQAP